jgi:ABC-2 type transport system ATP-binding protein
MIAGVLAPSAGSVACAGSLGLVPQAIALYPALSAEENLRFFGKVYGLGGRELDARVDELLEHAGLSTRRNDRVEFFSGGMKRRLNLACGLVHGPEVVLLDEPTVGVDPQSRNAILESVENLSGEGMAVLYTTHYMEEAERLCDRVGIIDQGTLKAEGTRRQLVQLVGEHDRISLRATGYLQPAVAPLQQVAGVVDVGTGDGVIQLVVEDAGENLTEILAVATANGASVTNVDVEEPNLESVFLHLTGRALRD